VNKIYKILGKRGRITIPYEIRINKKYSHNDVISFEEMNDNTVIIKKEQLCTDCKSCTANFSAQPTNETTLLDFLDGLSESEQRAALIHLSCKWAELQNKGIGKRI